ncbi:MAG: glycosyltransferase family 2 protein, partial [bacterium]
METLLLNKSEGPLVSVVIPFYNHVEVTLACLASFARNDPKVSYEVIVIDDASPEDVSRVAAVKWIKYVRNETNLGFLRTCNAAAKIATGKYICFLNNDTEVEAGWLEALVEVAEADPKVGIVGSALIYPDGSLQEAGGVLWSDGDGCNIGRNGKVDDPAFLFTRPVDYCSGASILVPRAVFEQVGYFDERYVPAYCEDSDLAMTMRANGFKVMYEPRSKVVHHEGVSSGTDLGAGIKQYQVDNSIKLREKWKGVLSAHAPHDLDLRFLASTRLAGRPRLLLLSPALGEDYASSRLWGLVKAARQSGCFITWMAFSGVLPAPLVADARRMGIEVYPRYVPTSDDPLTKERLKSAEAIFAWGADALVLAEELSSAYSHL